jgi:hypothetical protein
MKDWSMKERRSRSYWVVSVLIAAIVLGLFVWQPWNRNGTLWGN